MNLVIRIKKEKENSSEIDKTKIHQIDLHQQLQIN